MENDTSLFPAVAKKTKGAVAAAGIGGVGISAVLVYYILTCISVQSENYALQNEKIAQSANRISVVESKLENISNLLAESRVAQNEMTKALSRIEGKLSRE